MKSEWKIDAQKMTATNTRNGIVIKFFLLEGDALDGRPGLIPPGSEDELAKNGAKLMREAGDVFNTTLRNSPTWWSLRCIKGKYDLKGRQIAEWCGVSEQNARKWLMHPDAPSARPIPYAAWKLLRLIVGEDSIDILRQETIERETQ
jgi:hypothetical protein